MMTTPRHLALAVTLTISAAPSCAHLLRAQITNPDALVAPAPDQPEHRDQLGRTTLRSADLQWMWQYTQPAPTGNKAALLADPRFTALLRDQLKTPQAFWGNGRTLSEAATDFLASEGAVTAQDNRYLTVTGCVATQCGQKGILWIDLGTQTPLTIFVAKRWTEQSKTPDQTGAPFTYWVFPNELMNMFLLPEKFKASVGDWAMPPGKQDCSSATESGPLNSEPAYAAFFDVDGTAHFLSTDKLGVTNIICMVTNDPVITTKHRKN